MNNTALAILSSIFILGGSWLLSRFTNCGTVGSSSAAHFSVLDGELKTSPTDAFTFSLSGSTPTIPADTKVEMKKVADHLSNNPDRALSLIGNYFSSENPRGDVDLGLARAEAIKAQLVEWGAPEDNILTSSQRLNNLPSDGKVIYNPVLFSFLEKKTEEVSEVETNEPYPFVALEPFTLRFESGESDLTMTSDLRSYLDQALEYISQNSGTRFRINGYTDSDGSIESNKRLSRGRARSVREFFVENGIERESIRISGKGETNFVSDNDTEEGKALNRRVEIIVR